LKLQTSTCISDPMLSGSLVTKEWRVLRLRM